MRTYNRSYSHVDACKHGYWVVPQLVRDHVKLDKILGSQLTNQIGFNMGWRMLFFCMIEMTTV